MRFSKIFVLILALIALTCGMVYAGESTLPSLGESSVSIANRGNMAVVYNIRPAGGDWSSYTIESGKNTKISCGGCSTDLFEIVIVTEEKEVRYNLTSGLRYSIVWNSEASHWDVVELKN